MRNLVERLRRDSWYDAADEIERLRAELAQADAVIDAAEIEDKYLNDRLQFLRDEACARHASHQTGRGAAVCKESLRGE